MSPKKNNRPFSYNNEKSGLTKLPKRPAYPVPVTKTPEEVAQEIEGLRMHMKDQAKDLQYIGDESIKPNGLFDYIKPELPPLKSEECTSDNIPTEKPFSIITVSDKIMKKSWDDAQEALLSQMQSLTPVSEAYLVSKKLDKVLNEIKTERQFEQIYNESKSNHFKEKNLWLDEKALLKSRIVELEAFSYSQAEEKQNLINNLESEKQQLKSEYLELHAENVTLEGVLDEKILLEKELETFRKSRNQDLLLFLNQEEKIKTLEKKIAAKNDFIKDLQDEKFEVQVDLEEAKESIDKLNSELLNLQDSKDKLFWEYLKINGQEIKKVADKKDKEIADLQDELLSAQCSYKSSQRLLNDTSQDLDDTRNLLRERNRTISNQAFEIHQLKNILENSFSNKIKTSFINLFNKLKSNGTLYFAIWFFVWVLFLFTVFKIIR